MRFVAEMPRLQQMLSYVRTAAHHAGFDSEQLGRIELAAEEALVNIILHAYRDHTVGEIEIQCRSPGREILEIDVSDRGPPFNPLEEPVAASQQGEGGLGLLLMRGLMDQVGYRRQGERNVLTMVKRI
jgi:anti-sigma regulatory factor (Ser/Thr protein kinase)